jgi:hypothetical protein
LLSLLLFLLSLALLLLLLLLLLLPLSLVGAAAISTPDAFMCTFAFGSLGSPKDPFLMMVSESTILSEITVLP